MALPLYTVTLFISAFILFLIQPMIGKLLLPKLGGTPQVWNTCMVFFQMVLLAGYAYSHTVSTRLKLRQQFIVHGILLFLPFLVLLPLPFNIGAWTPDLGVNPIPSTLLILLLTVALPFAVVATSAPLLQKWFIYTGHPAAKDPYFLYGASNFGSMLALLAYPFLIEPYTTIKNDDIYELTQMGYRLSQPWIWTIGYGVLVVAVLGCIAFVWKPAGVRLSNDVTITPEAVPSTAHETGITTHPKPHAPNIALPPSGHGAHEEVTMARRLRWILLAAVPSSLMLGVTSFITTDLTPLPLFWLIPLTLYLASFILVFARWPIVWVDQPHRYMLYAQPLSIALMLFVGYLFHVSHAYLWPSVICYVIGFFLTTMVCHGELAKDRPSPRFLTEFYLWMSFGGMLGGMFNGLFAPVVFRWGILEFPIAVLAACLLRPSLGDGIGVIDSFINSLFNPAEAPPAPVKGKGAKRHVPHVPTPAVAMDNPSMSRMLDIVVPIVLFIVCYGLYALLMQRMKDHTLAMFIVFGIPLILACVVMVRPTRFACAIAAVMLVHWMTTARGNVIFQTRSYFGHIMVLEDDYRQPGLITRSLTHGTTHHGLNYLPPNDVSLRGNPAKDFSRLATTYYHRQGPAGRVMEMPGFNWFPGPPNTYYSDMRMPASLVGSVLSGMGEGSLTAMCDLWSEPPFATVGLGTGTMASYGRPYQHVHYYEIDNQIRNLSLPWGEAYYTYKNLPPFQPNEVYFNYLYNAIARGCEVQVYMGDARQRMALPYENFHKSNDKNPPGGGPENFYRMMVVDAFSSDAIPAHLLTLEGLEMYFKHLTPDGILAIHTSNRYVDLPKVAATIAAKNEWSFLRGHDVNPFGDEKSRSKNETDHSTSEWIMVCRQPGPLAELDRFVPEGYDEAYDRRTPNHKPDPYWSRDVALNPRFLWTDDFTNLWAVMRRRDDH